MHDDRRDGLAVFGATELRCTIEPVAQPLAQFGAPVFYGDLHDVRAQGVTAAYRDPATDSVAARGGSIMCQRGVISAGSTNSKF